jgi:putative salt-induced outer membrane protein
VPSKTFILALAAASAVGAPAVAKPLPEGVTAMIRKAAEAGDPAVLAAVLQVARQANPESLAEIDAAAKPEPAGAAVKRIAGAAAAPAAPPAWKGSVELGGGLSTGATQATGGYGAVDITHAVGRWRDRLVGRGDYQKTDGETSTERLSIAYEPRLDLSSATYAFGLTQYEHDRIQGYQSRYTVGAGLGLEISRNPALKLALDFGPAVRVTRRYDGPGDDATLAARGGVKLKWLPSERVTLSEESALYADDGETSAKSITSLDTLLFGPFKARLSYDVSYEKNPSLEGPKLATTTRASLLYSF